MSTKLSRRECLAPIAGAMIATRGMAAPSAKAMRGAFMILTTPFTATGAVDWEDLEGEARFVDRCGGHGIVWPQGSSGVAFLSREERMRGMEVLARAMRGKRAVLVLGVQGKDTEEMLEYARLAGELEPDAMIAMPPSSGKSQQDYHAYFRALAKTISRPVIMQTSGGARDLAPSVELMVGLAREFPHMAYIKEESNPTVERMLAELKQRPPLLGVFGANLGQVWLYELRLGLDGVITGNAMYADLMAAIWNLHEQGKAEQARDAFSRFLLMRNAAQQIPGADLYVMKKRGVFKTTAARREGGQVTEAKLSPAATAEIDFRFAALEPYLAR
jgi:4-hydroxy-tetrahydrodipicolinate synthase